MQLKQKLNASQQAVAMYSSLAEEASLAQAEAEKCREESEAQEKLWREQQEAMQVENNSLKEDTQQLKRKVFTFNQIFTVCKNVVQIHHLQRLQKLTLP